MSFLSGIFKKSANTALLPSPLLVDMHSHLIPGIDDGVDDFEESVAIVKGLKDIGYKKLITTPHIMSDFYRNEPEVILEGRDKLRAILKEREIDIEIEAAAEYYLDDHFENMLSKKNLLTFGDNYVLVETSYLNAPSNFIELIFNAKIAGYKPILAHPERYIFLYDDFGKYEELYGRDILFQLNLASLVGYYSKEAKKIAENLLKNNMVNFIGTDIHHIRHLDSLIASTQTPAFQAATGMKLLNNTLL